MPSSRARRTTLALVAALAWPAAATAGPFRTVVGRSDAGTNMIRVLDPEEDRLPEGDIQLDRVHPLPDGQLVRERIVRTQIDNGVRWVAVLELTDAELNPRWSTQVPLAARPSGSINELPWTRLRSTHEGIEYLSYDGGVVWSRVLTEDRGNLSDAQLIHVAEPSFADGRDGAPLFGTERHTDLDEPRPAFWSAPSWAYHVVESGRGLNAKAIVLDHLYLKVIEIPIGEMPGERLAGWVDNEGSAVLLRNDADGNGLLFRLNRRQRPTETRFVMPSEGLQQVAGAFAFDGTFALAMLIETDAGKTIELVRFDAVTGQELGRATLSHRAIEDAAELGRGGLSGADMQIGTVAWSRSGAVVVGLRATSGGTRSGLRKADPLHTLAFMAVDGKGETTWTRALPLERYETAHEVRMAVDGDTLRLLRGLASGRAYRALGWQDVDLTTGELSAMNRVADDGVRLARAVPLEAVVPIDASEWVMPTNTDDGLMREGETGVMRFHLAPVPGAPSAPVGEGVEGIAAEDASSDSADADLPGWSDLPK